MTIETAKPAAKELPIRGIGIASVRLVMPDTIKTTVVRESTVTGKAEQANVEEIPFSAVVKVAANSPVRALKALGVPIDEADAARSYENVTFRLSNEKGERRATLAYTQVLTGKQEKDVYTGRRLVIRAGQQTGPYSYADEDEYEDVFEKQLVPYRHECPRSEDLPMTGEPFTELYIGLHNAGANGEAGAQALLAYLAQNYPESAGAAITDIRSRIEKQIDESRAREAEMARLSAGIQLPGDFRDAAAAEAAS